MSKTTKLSIWFASCVSIGLLLGYHDGFPVIALAKTALLASILFVVFLLGQHAYRRYLERKTK